MDRDLAPVTRNLALFASALLLVMVLLTFATGVAQEPFEVVRPLEAYRAELRDQASTLQLILALDALFIAAYSAFFVVFARAVEGHGVRELLRLGTLALLVTAGLDMLEDQQLFALSRSVVFGEELGWTTLRAQHVLSQTKFHVSYVGLFLLGLGLPRRGPFERLFAGSIALPMPVLGAVLWVAPPSLVGPLSVVRWFGFLAGFAGAVVLCQRATKTGAPARESATSARA